MWKPGMTPFNITPDRTLELDRFFTNYRRGSDVRDKKRKREGYKN